MVINRSSSTKAIIESLYTKPFDWKIGFCTIDHVGGLVEIWDENIPFIDTYLFTPRRKLSLIEKWRLYRAVRHWKKGQTDD